MTALLLALLLAAPERVVVVAKPTGRPGVFSRVRGSLGRAIERLYRREDDDVARGNGLLLTPSGADLGVLKFLPELEKIQKGEIESRLTVQYDDKYPWFAWPAFALLCAAAALGEGPLRRRLVA